VLQIEAQSCALRLLLSGSYAFRKFVFFILFLAELKNLCSWEWLPLLLLRPCCLFIRLERTFPR
jgi:hypothetical protein